MSESEAVRLEANSDSEESMEEEESEEDDNDEATYKVVKDQKLAKYKMESDMFKYDQSITGHQAF